MIRIGSLGPDSPRRVINEESHRFRGFVDQLIESDKAASPFVPAPQAYVVNQTAGWVFPAHFHLEDQFQLVTGGSGRIGRAHEASALTVHYASRESGYGPITAGAEGLQYVTLRNITDPGAWYLPEQKTQLTPGLKKEQFFGHPRAEAVDTGAARAEELIAPQDNGVAAWLVRVPGGMEGAAPPLHPQGGGRFHVITKGCIAVQGGAELSALAVVYTTADERVIQWTAVNDDAEIVVLQFPASSLPINIPKETRQ